MTHYVNKAFNPAGTTFEERYPDIAGRADIRHFVQVDVHDHIVEAWTRDSKGRWINTTELDRSIHDGTKLMKKLCRQMDRANADADIDADCEVQQ